MIIAVPVTTEGNVDPRWGKASTVAIAKVEGTEVTAWNEYNVNWDRLHDEGTEGSHHARIVKFLREHEVQAVVIDHCGAPMLNTMQKMNLVIALDAEGPARPTVLAAAPQIKEVLETQGGGCCGGNGAGGCGCDC